MNWAKIITLLAVSVVASSQTQQTPPQTARQAVLEMLFSKSPKAFEKHVPEQALEIFQAHQDEIRLIFSDMGLPSLSGAELIGQAKALKPDVKTVLSSGYTESELKGEMVKHGIDGFVSKPYDARLLLQTLREILDGKKLA